MDSITFADLGLSPKVFEAVNAAGYTTPTPIQCEAIPIAVTGQDVLGIAQTGTGKTASFTLPMITRLEKGRARARMPRSLILAPTRELAAQVAEAFEKYGVNHKLTLALLIGGVSFAEQDKKIDRGVDVLIATPGRLLDHLQRGKLLLSGVEILVIDEADRMLDMGFIPDIERICKVLPPRRQTLFFSATMPPVIQRLVDQFLRTPVRIEVARPATTANTITQRFKYCADNSDWAKRDVLRAFIREQDVKNAIIFCNRKRDVAVLHKSLLKHGFNAGALHGDMDQRSRTETLDQFRNDEIAFLAASDVAARGLDIPEVSHVFNFDVPMSADDYVHRIGRTGRAGLSGFAGTLVCAKDLPMLGEISKVTGQETVWIGDGPQGDDQGGGDSRRRHGREHGRERGRDDGGRQGNRSGGRGGRRPDRNGGRDARDNGDNDQSSGTGSGSGTGGRGPRDDALTQEDITAREDARYGSGSPEVAARDSGREEQTNRRRRGGRGRRASSADDHTPDTRQEASSSSSRRGGRRAAQASSKRSSGGDLPGGPDAFSDDTLPAFLQRPVRVSTAPSDPSDTSNSDPT